MAHGRSNRRDSEEGVRFQPAVFITLVIVSVILIVFDRPQSRPDVLSNARAAFNDASLPVLELAAWPLRGVRNIGPWWRRQFELAEENRDLREELAELRAWRDVALSLRDRVRVYERALNLDTPAARERITAWAVAERAGPFVRSRLLGVGAQDGVAEGYPVVNIYGLVGRAIDVGRRSSRVLLLTDLNSRVAVMADRSNARAMLTGDNTDFPRLEYLGIDPDIRAGDRVVTSGDDNVLPRGLPVGEVVRDRDGGWRVALYSDAAPIDLVWIWPFDPVPAPETDPAEAGNTVESPEPEDQSEVAGEGDDTPSGGGSAPVSQAPETGDAPGAQPAQGGR